MNPDAERSFIVAEADRQIKFFQDMVKTVQNERDAAQAENAKLREALAEILKWFGDYPSFIPSYENVIQDRVEDAIEQARAALAEPRKE